MGTKQIYVIGEISIYSVNFELLVNDFLGSSQFKRKADASKVSFLLLLHFTHPPTLMTTPISPPSVFA